MSRVVALRHQSGPGDRGAAVTLGTLVCRVCARECLRAPRADTLVSKAWDVQIDSF